MLWTNPVSFLPSDSGMVICEKKNHSGVKTLWTKDPKVMTVQKKS